jgi:hypothetical protein
MAVDGLTTLRSSFGPRETMNKLEVEVKAKGMMVSPASSVPRAPPELLCCCAQPRCSSSAMPELARR